MSFTTLAVIVGALFLVKSASTLEDKHTPNELAKPFINDAKWRIQLLEEKLEHNTSAKVTIAGVANKQHNLGQSPPDGTALAIGQWKTKYGQDRGDSVRQLFCNFLQQEFKKMMDKFPGRVSYDFLKRKQASQDHIMVWAANTTNVDGEYSSDIDGKGQAEAMCTHGPGVFGIITTPGGGIPSGKNTKAKKLVIETLYPKTKQ